MAKPNEFDNHPEGFKRRNPDLFGGARVRPAEPKQAERVPLDRPKQRKAKGSDIPSTRYMVHFRVCAVRPLDWDNYALKYLQDLLCLTGLIPGDSWRILEGRVSSRKVRSAEEEQTEIIIETITL